MCLFLRKPLHFKISAVPLRFPHSTSLIHRLSLEPIITFLSLYGILLISRTTCFNCECVRLVYTKLAMHLGSLTYLSYIQPRTALSRHNVFPVPVGDSSMQFILLFKPFGLIESLRERIICLMYLTWIC